jgi:RNA polymerase sigma-70 factor (ECF subfamily)
MMPDDRLLMKRVRAGDERAFAALVERHGGRMLAVAAHLLGSRADGEDAVQRAFLRCFTAAGAYRPEWAVSTWLYRILTNVCVDEIRRRRARREVPEDGGAPGGSWSDTLARRGTATRRAAAQGDAGGRHGRPSDPSGRRAADRAAARLDIARALHQVPNEARALLVLRYADGLSYGELARVRGITINTVKSQLARGKAILKTALAEERR